MSTADGVNAGGTAVRGTYDGTGEAEWIAIGSEDPANDRVRAGRVRHRDDAGDRFPMRCR